MRYSRNQTTISTEQQNKLQNARVLVIGLGGLGGFVIEGLARMGVLQLGICDNDVFDISNLNRQVLATQANINTPKLIAAVDRIKCINSDVQITTYANAYPNQTISQDFLKYDLVIDCLDNAATRSLLEKECILNNIPLIYGAIAGNYAYLAIISPQNQIITQQVSDSLEKILGNPFYTVACAAALQLNLAIKVLLNETYLEKGFYVVDLQDMSIETVTIE